MKHTHTRTLTLVAVLCIAGCQSSLAEKRMAVQRSKATADQLFADVVEKVIAASDEMADHKHDLQRSVIDREWADWKDSHTDESGFLVSIDANGQKVPLLAGELDAAISARADKLAQLERSKDSWRKVTAPVATAIAQFRAATTSKLETDEEIHEAEKSAQEFIRATIEIVGGLGAAFGAAAL